MPLPWIDPKDVAEVMRQGTATLAALNVVLLQLEKMGVDFRGVDFTKELPAMLAALRELVVAMRCPS
jgi:hypothetical protein